MQGLARILKAQWVSWCRWWSGCRGFRAGRCRWRSDRGESVWDRRKRPPRTPSPCNPSWHLYLWLFPREHFPTSSWATTTVCVCTLLLLLFSPRLPACFGDIFSPMRMHACTRGTWHPPLPYVTPCAACATRVLHRRSYPTVYVRRWRLRARSYSLLLVPVKCACWYLSSRLPRRPGLRHDHLLHILHRLVVQHTHTARIQSPRI